MTELQNNDQSSYKHDTPTEFNRTLTLLDATMIVAGSMIGSGIFIVTAEMGRTVGGTGLMLSLWLLTGVITIFAALSYGELAGMMPKAGGQFVYIQRAWGDMTAFLYGWAAFGVMQTGLIAAVAVAFAKYMAQFFPTLGPDNILMTIGAIKISAAQIVAILSLALLTYINSRGIQNGKIIQLVFTLAKLGSLFALIVLGLFIGLQGDVFSHNFQDMWHAFSVTKDKAGVWQTQDLVGFGVVLAMGTAIVNPLFSSDAWNNVTFIAGEIKDPRRNIPRSLLLGTLIVTALYILANLAYLALLPLHGDPNGADELARGITHAQNERVGSAAVSVMFGSVGAKVMAFLIIVSTFGCNSGLILSGARVYYSMAQQGLFFRQAGVLNENKVPGFALWIQFLWTSLLCLSGTYGDLLDYCIFVSLLFYVVTIAGVIRLRSLEPDAERPYKVPFYPIIPLIYIVLASAIAMILLYTKTGNTVSGLLIVALGVPFYFLSKRNVAK
jgi:basic amino acid/polyamine antiporter, APA family